MKPHSALAGPTLTICTAVLLAFAIPSPVDGPPVFPDMGARPIAHGAAPPTPTPAAPTRAPPAVQQGLVLELSAGYYTRHTSNPAHTQPVQIRIDPAFTTQEREMILDAVREWNHVLNGHVRIAIGGWDGPASSRPASAAMSQPGEAVWTVHRADRSIYTTESRPLALTLVLPAPSATIVLFVDRMRGARIDRVMLHEIGHALGLQHDPPGHLMQEQYRGNEQICIDRAAVEKLAQLRGIPVRELNWCTY